MGGLNFLGNVLLRCMPESKILFFIKESTEKISKIDFKIVYRTYRTIIFFSINMNVVRVNAMIHPPLVD